MGVFCESLCEEYLVAGSYHTSVVDIDIIDEKPRTDAVVGQCTTLLCQLHDILIEEQACLVLRVLSRVVR